MGWESDLELLIDQAMPGDRFRFRRRLRALRGTHARSTQHERLRQHVERSARLLERRRTSVPAIHFDSDLPILACRDAIARAVAEHPTVIVCGETGSGKSTQLPKILLQSGRGVLGVIGHTQPRRIAARSVACRLAHELRSPLGQDVGFKIRFDDQTRPETYVKLMTDGVLLAETQTDRFLNQYDTIIVDEAHERSLNIDFLLGYVKGLLERRPDLRLVITSATIDARRFSEHFGGPRGPAPVVEVSGRSYDVEMRYRPLDTTDDAEGDLPVAIVEAVGELARDQPGDILVFLPTEREIRETARSLRGAVLAQDRLRGTEILPLYARLSTREQNRVFEPHAHRRIVLATNVAESSLTVPGIRSVVDSGTARLSRYSARSKVQRLPIEPVSQASANQRAGRCGRLGPGICIRLFSEDDYLGRDPYTTPEIRRTNLAAVILQTLALRLGPIEQFPFLDPPRPDAIRDGYRTLFELGAIDDRHQLTSMGTALARLPVDPRIGRMVLAATDHQCLHEILIIAAALEVQDPRDRPVDKQQAADERHAQWSHESSDFLTLLNLWRFYQHLRETLSRSQLRRACKDNFLSLTRLREWADVHRQLVEMAGSPSRDRPGSAGGPVLPAPASSVAETRAPTDDYERVHRALLAGLLSGVALRTERSEYTGAGGNKLILWPGSVLRESRPLWIMASELVETSRRYCRTAAKIDPMWIEPAAGHLVERSYSDAHWHAQGGTAMAYERVSLFGLPVVQRRRVPLAPVDPERARSLLIEHGLSEGLVPPSKTPGFLERNRALVRELEELAARTRRGDLVIGQHTLVEFYDARVPPDVRSLDELVAWIRRSPREAQALVMTRDDLLNQAADADTMSRFPDAMSVESVQLPLAYRFEPGSDADGVTLTVPIPLVGRLDESRLGWLVPGLLEEKILALIRSLPKHIRRNLVPAPDTARRAVQFVQFGEGPFLESVARALSRASGETVPAGEFRIDTLPQHLRLNVRVVDDQGQAVAESRQLDQLATAFARQAATSLAALQDSESWNRTGLRKWDVGDLPQRVELVVGGLPVVAYPAVFDEGECAGLRLFQSPAEAEVEHRAGVRRLLWLAHQRELRAQVAWLPGLDEMKLCAGPLARDRPVERQLAELLADRAFLGTGQLPRTMKDFESLSASSAERIALAVQDVAPLAARLFKSFHAARLAIDQTPDRWTQAREDARRQLAELACPGFLANTPWQWLEHFPRYFKAIAQRLEKLAQGGAGRDEQAMRELAPHLEALDQWVSGNPRRAIWDPHGMHYRWMIEEFRVSLFAQTLGTSMSISAKRLEKQRARLGASE